MKKLIPKIVGSYLNVLSYVSADYAANKALHLFSTPRKGLLKDKHHKFLNTAIQEVLYYDDLPVMTYHWKGKKQTILLVHGWESNAARWKKKIKHFLKNDFNIIALDAPAHGASGSKVFNALLYSEFINIVVKKHNPSIIIGHSVGGMSSVFFQQKYQHKSIEKIILLGSPSEFKDILKRYIEMLGYNKKIENQLNTVIFDQFGAHPEDFSTANFIKEISSKSLIIHDTKDAIIPYSDAELISKSHQYSYLISTTGLGHSLNDHSVTKSILDFINS